MTEGLSRRVMVQASLAAVLIPGVTRAARGPTGEDGWTGWDGLAARHGQQVRLAGFLQSVPAVAGLRPSALLLPCLPAVGLPDAQRVVLQDPSALPAARPGKILVVVASGRLAPAGAGHAMRAQVRLLWTG